MNDVFWVTHNGRDVYVGNPGVDHHISYHESGKLHVKSKGQKQDELKHIPLAKVVGKYNILTSLFPNSAWQFDDFPVKKQYRGRKSDAVLVIDSRSIPTGALVMVSIGVVEPGRLDALKPMTTAHEEIGVDAKQILIATNVRPWVYVVVYWGTEDEFNTHYRQGGLPSTT